MNRVVIDVITVKFMGGNFAKGITKMNEEVVNFLNSLGCCQRCILVFFGVQNIEAYYDNSSIQKAISQILTLHSPKWELKVDSNASEMCHIHNRLSCKETDKEVSAAAAVKRQKLITCVTCLGLFQWASSEEAQHLMIDVIHAGDYDCPDLNIMLTLPLSITFRVQRVWGQLLQHFPNFPANHRTFTLDILKDLWKHLNGPLVGSQVGKAFHLGKQINLALEVIAHYPDDAKDCSVLDKLCNQITKDKHKQHPNSLDNLDKNNGNHLEKLEDVTLLNSCPELPPVPESSISLGKMYCLHTPFYIAGRYNKFSRNLSQTPVMVKGERRTPSTVQEIICGVLMPVVKANNVKFMATGSEEAEVRCLGRGRPFVIEFLDPHRINFEKDQLAQLQQNINETTDLISVRDLQIIARRQICSEEERMKYHVVLCCIREGYDLNELDLLNQIRELNIEQKTPLRALHRRPMAIKSLKLHQISAFPVNQYFFKLHISSGGGLDMKELINGDMGRTVPSIASILGKTVTLIALDVEDVELDWPPKVDETT